MSTCFIYVITIIIINILWINPKPYTSEIWKGFNGTHIYEVYIYVYIYIYIYIYICIEFQRFVSSHDQFFFLKCRLTVI